MMNRAVEIFQLEKKKKEIFQFEENQTEKKSKCPNITNVP